MSQEILILGLNPAWQRLFYVDKFTPGEVHRIKKVEEYGSGKGINCGLVLRLLGGTPLMMHFLGSEHGSRIFDEISAYGIQQAPVWIKEPTRIFTTIVSEGEYAGKTLNEVVAIMRDRLLGADNYRRFGVVMYVGHMWAKRGFEIDVTLSYYAHKDEFDAFCGQIQHIIPTVRQESLDELRSHFTAPSTIY